MISVSEQILPTDTSGSAMPRVESILAPMEFTTARRAHRCGYNEEHRLETGMPRLTIRADRVEQHYCLACAAAFLAQGIEHLQLLLVGAERLAHPRNRPTSA